MKTPNEISKEQSEITWNGVMFIKNELCSQYGNVRTHVAFEAMEQALVTVAEQSTQARVPMGEVMDIFVILVNAVHELKRGVQNKE